MRRKMRGPAANSGSRRRPPLSFRYRIAIMKTSFQIFTRDLRRIFRSPLAMLVLIGVILLPCLYAWVNIGAYADPYSYTSGLKVAVSSRDQGADNELTGKLNAGDKVVDALKENDSLGWVFTDPEEAVEGVRSGEYYAAIIIPESFSEDLLSITTGELRQPVLEYYLNEKKNAMAPLIMNVGARTLKNQINQQFIDAVVEAVAEIAQSMMEELGADLESVNSSLTADLNAVSANLSDYESMAAGLQGTLSQTQGFDSSIRSRLQDIAASAASCRTTLAQADKSLRSQRSAIRSFSDSMNRTMSNGSLFLADVRLDSDRDFNELKIKALEVNEKIGTAVDRLQQVTDWNTEMIGNMTELNRTLNLPETNALLQRLEERNREQKELLNALQGGSLAVGDAAQKTGDNAAQIRKDIDAGRTAILNAQSSYSNDTYGSISETLDQLSFFLGRAGGILEPVDSQIDQMGIILDGLDRSLDDINDSLGAAQSSLAGVREQVNRTITDLNALESSEEYQEILSAGIDGKALSGFISSPVELKTETFFKVRNYGSAMSPFFTNLAIWVGGMVLLSLFRLEVDTDENIRSIRPAEGYWGRWALFFVVGQAQAITVCLGDLLMMRVQCAHPLLFILSGMMASFVYISLIFALAITLKHVGKALCIIILIFQIPASSGTYPMEMTSLFFRVLHPVIPFTYGVNAMREAQIGIYGHHYALAMARLLLFIVAALCIGLLRPLLINLNVLFDKKLAETDLMICEEAGPEQERFRLMAAVRLLSGRDRFRENTEARIRRFEDTYQKRIRQSFRFVLIALPVIFLMLMFTLGVSRLIFLILWIISLIALMTFQIVIEYFREHLDRQKRMAEMSDEALLRLLNRREQAGTAPASGSPAPAAAAAEKTAAESGGMPPAEGGTEAEAGQDPAAGEIVPEPPAPGAESEDEIHE